VCGLFFVFCELLCFCAFGVFVSWLWCFLCVSVLFVLCMCCGSCVVFLFYSLLFCVFLCVCFCVFICLNVCGFFVLLIFVFFVCVSVCLSSVLHVGVCFCVDVGFCVFCVCVGVYLCVLVCIRLQCFHVCVCVFVCFFCVSICVPACGSRLWDCPSVFSLCACRALPVTGGPEPELALNSSTLGLEATVMSGPWGVLVDSCGLCLFNVICSFLDFVGFLLMLMSVDCSVF